MACVWLAATVVELAGADAVMVSGETGSSKTTQVCVFAVPPSIPPSLQDHWSIRMLTCVESELIVAVASGHVVGWKSPQHRHTLHPKLLRHTKTAGCSFVCALYVELCSQD